MDIRIVGVAGDANYLEIREPERRGIYLPAFHNGRVDAQTFLIRTAIDPEGLASDVRRVARDVVKTVPVTRITTLNDQIDASIVSERLIATLSGFFGALGALLVAIGIYGLLAYTVTPSGVPQNRGGRASGKEYSFRRSSALGYASRIRPWSAQKNGPADDRAKAKLLNVLAKTSISPGPG